MPHWHAARSPPDVKAATDLYTYQAHRSPVMPCTCVAEALLSSSIAQATRALVLQVSVERFATPGGGAMVRCMSGGGLCQPGKRDRARQMSVEGLGRRGAWPGSVT